MVEFKSFEVNTPIRLDFGCGNNCKAGFEGVDLYAPEAQHKIDLFIFPYPWADGSVDEINCSHFLEHIPKDSRWPFFEECYRILKIGGILNVTVPNWKSERAYGDNSHEWPPITTMTFFYINKKWRVENKLTYGKYDLKCDFDFNVGANGIYPQFSQRSQEALVYALTHYLETYSDMWAILTKRGKNA